MNDAVITINKINTSNIADVQNLEDKRQLAINKVGIKDIRHPICLHTRDGHTQHTIANFNMMVNLPHNVKGTHMSRFIEILNDYKTAITVESFKNIVKNMTEKLEANSGHIEMHFPYFINKAAPITKVESLMDYQAAFIADLVNGKLEMWLKVIVPVTSLCPCSKKISNYGAHNQRSHVTVLASINNFIWLEELIELIEQQASCELYGLLKRPDEKYVTERAYDNPKFVEDMVRDIAVCLNKDTRIISYKIESENFESIHNHSAYAMIEHNKFNHAEK
jgi:GTP cyclohydrolase I